MDLGQEAILSQQFQMIIGRMKETPRLGGVLTRLMRFAEPDPLSPAMLERMCAGEPALNHFVQFGLAIACKRLQLKGDPTFGLCVQHLGIHRVQRIVAISALGSYALQCMPRSGIKCSDIVGQGIARGVFASKLGKYATDTTPEDLFTMGLFSVIGIPLMAFVFGPRYRSLYFSLQGTNIQLAKREADELGMDHLRCASLILEQFNYDKTRLETLQSLVESVDNLRGGPQALLLGTILAHEAGFHGGVGNLPPDFKRTWIIRLGIKEADLKLIASEAAAESQWSELILNASAAA